MQGFQTNGRHIRIKPLTLIFFISMVQLGVAFLTVPMIFTFDESIWHYIGRNWIRNGLVPYQGGVDNKSPLIFLIFGVSDWLFGVNYWFPRILGIAVQSTGIYFLYKIAEKTISKQAGLLVIGFFGLSLIWRSTGGKYVSYTETYALTSIILAVYFCVVCENKTNAFWGGVFAGLGLGFRLTAVFGIVPIFLFSFKKNRKSALVFLCGLAGCIGILLFVANLAGISMHELVFFGITDNFGSGSATDHTLAWKLQRFSDTFFYSEIILFYPEVFCYFVLVRKVDFLKLWLVSEVLGILLLGMFDRSHFKNLLPVFSLMSAFVAGYLMENYQMPPKMILLGIWIIFFPKTFEPLYSIKKLFISRNDRLNPNMSSAVDDQETSKKTMGLWIRSHTAPGEKVYVAGYGAVTQVYSERISPSIFFNVTQTQYAKKRLFRDLATEKPVMVVLPSGPAYSLAVDPDMRYVIDQFILGNYRLDTSIANYSIFRLKAGLNP